MRLGPYSAPVLVGVAIAAVIWCVMLASSLGVGVNSHHKDKGKR